MPTRDVVLRIIGKDDASPAFAKAGAAAETMATRVSKAGDKAVAAGRTLTHKVTLPILALGVASVKMATDFNSSMTRIQTQAGASARDVQILTKQVLAMKNVQQGPNELAGALYHLKSVGMDNVSAMKALRVASDLAAVGHANLEETTNALAGAWRTGIRGAKDFHRAAATVNAVIGAGNMTLEDFTAALGTGILPTAKTFGLTMKDVGSALALFTDEGVPADAAATRLRMSISLLGAPSQAAEKQLKKIGLTGLNLANDMRKPNGIIRAIGDLKAHLEDPKYKLSLSQQAQLLSHAFGGGRSSSAILSMINNFDVLKKKQDQVTNSLGKYDHAVKVQRETPEAVFKQRIANLERSLTVVGTNLLPVVVSGVQELSKVSDVFNHMSDGQKRFAAEALLVAVAIGPVLSIGGRLVKLFATVAGAGKAASLWMAAPYRAAATSAELSAVQIQEAQRAEQLATPRAAALMAVAEATKANAAAESAVSIAASLEGTNSILAAGSTLAAENAIEFAASQQLMADSAVRAAAETDAAWTAAMTELRVQQGLTTRSMFGLQTAATGLGIGLTTGMFTRGASTSTKLMASLGAAGAGAAIGWSMGGPWGAAIGGLTGGLSSLATQFFHTGHSADSANAEAIRAQQRTQAAIAATKQAVGELTSAIDADSGAWRANTRAAVAGQVIKSGAALNASQIGLDPSLVTKAVLGNQKAQNKITNTVGRLQARAARLRARGGEQMVPQDLRDELKWGNQLLAELAQLGVETHRATAGVDRLAVADGKLHLAMRPVSVEAHRVGTALRGNTAEAQLNRDFIRAHIQAINDAALAELRHGASLRKVNRDAQGQLGAFQRLLRQYKFNAGAVSDLTARLFHLPKKVTTSPKVQTDDANREIHALEARIARTKAHIARRAKLGLNTADAQFLLKLLNIQLVGLTSKHWPIKVDAQTSAAQAHLNSIITTMHTIGQGVNAVVNITTTNTKTGGRNTVKAQAAGTLSAFGTATIPPNTAFTVGERGWEGGVTDSAGRASIFSNTQSKAMGFPTPYANGTGPKAGRQTHRIVIGADVIRQLKRALEGNAKEVVLAELDYAG